uniref:Uncharacterized protein n=1 Tax=Romanomermis culicivorax TaxID=13658 RepID=A0A915JY50_ROMCU
MENDYCEDSGKLRMFEASKCTEKAVKSVVEILDNFTMNREKSLKYTIFIALISQNLNLCINFQLYSITQNYSFSKRADVLPLTTPIAVTVIVKSFDRQCKPTVEHTNFLLSSIA